ncbi:sodium-independent sulfate anion transporter-like isoform X2 [Diachasmimorpha longicaudata]|uniref:sodium-independent sulfate anion transporter-like isoform X2 n=1 Tax=Diachasmimorpha longicaudata TaxID=58733 RepID=UPI0030B8D16C
MENGESKETMRKKNAKFFINKYVPITRWLPKYSRFYAISDFIAGITLGLTMIPQSIAYAGLAHLTPQYGLYSSFIGGFVYIFFGTIKEVSIGATSLMALVTAEFTSTKNPDFAVLLCFLAGCAELCMGIFNLGFLVDFISIPVTSGFTSATSIIIVISQLPGLVGVKIKSESIIHTLVQLYEKRWLIRWNDTALGITCILFLLAFRKLKDIPCDAIKRRNQSAGILLEKTLWFLSISRNALIVVITSTITFRYHQDGEYIFNTAATVRPGLPEFSPPPFSTQHENVTYSFYEMCSHLGSGIIMVPLIAVLANVAIAKAFVRDGPVEATQEMLTLGVCNIAGSFFRSMPTCGAFTRSAVGSASGIQTPMAGLYSGIMTLLALSFLTPYFGFIPRSTLSAVLIAAVIFLIDVKIMKVLWRGNKKDLFIAVGTFIISILLNVETGLLFGTVVNALFLLYLSARPTVEIHSRKTVLDDKYVLVKPEIGLFYPAVSFLTTKIIKVAYREARGIYPVVVDFERLQGIDYTATKGIENLINAFEGKSQQLIFLHVSPYVVNSIENFGMTKKIYFIDCEDHLLNVFASLKRNRKEEETIVVTFKELLEKSESKEPEPHPEVEALLPNPNSTLRAIDSSNR